MDLSNLKPAKGSTKNRKRIGRGQGSGYGNHSSTKGNKGQKARSGGGVPIWFEGGQMPLHRRLPKYGFTPPNRVSYNPVNLSRLARMIDEGLIQADEEITPQTLVKIGVAKKRGLVKILGDGEISQSLKVAAHAFSKSAQEKIEAAGGSVRVVEQQKTKAAE